MVEEVEVLIIGAGPTGLGAAVRLEERNVQSWLICDQADKPGGLARTDLTKEGFYFDLGGHVIFSHYEYFDKLLEASLGGFEDAECWTSHARECYIRYKQEWVPYPFQNNLYCIPKRDRVDCLLGLVEAKLQAECGGIAAPRNFDEWILQTMGQGLANCFMRPYNFKVWAIPCELMSSTWLGERVSVVDYAKAIRNTIMEERDVGWGPNAIFRFPRKRGGTGAIWQAVADKFLPAAKCRYNAKLVYVDLDAKLASFENGMRIKYDKLITTMPLDLFLRQTSRSSTTIANPVLERVKASAVPLLVHSSTNVIGFGVRGKNPHGTKCWLYFPESNCPFYRATIFSNYSENNVPSSTVLLPTICLAGGGDVSTERGKVCAGGPYWSLMLEVSESAKYKPVDQNTLVRDALRGCIEAGLLCAGDEIVSIYHQRLEHGYPTPSLARDEALEQVLPLLRREYNVWSRGRFGSWKYEVGNQDHSLILGVEAVDSILGGARRRGDGEEESTLRQSNLVNSRGKNVWPKFGMEAAFYVARDRFATSIQRLQGKRFGSVEEFIIFMET